MILEGRISAFNFGKAAVKSSIRDSVLGTMIFCWTLPILTMEMVRWLREISMRMTVGGAPSSCSRKKATAEE